MLLLRHEKIFIARSKCIEQDIIGVLYTTDEKDIARIAVKYRHWPDVLTAVLVNLVRIVGGEEKIILKTIFALALPDNLIAGELDPKNDEYKKALTWIPGRTDGRYEVRLMYQPETFTDGRDSFQTGPKRPAF
ncbi:MAG: hypothetical protein ACYDH3_04350 [Candidatus Aminicenantales bacterium]